MIAYIEGTLVAAQADHLIVSTSAGVGYQLFVPQSVLQVAQPDQTYSFHVHTHFRDSEISLFGFSSLSDKLLFQTLIQTSGVGPKLGLAILSHMSAQEIITAAQLKDPNAFSAVSGVGKKTAAKLALDMGDAVKKHPQLAVMAQDTSQGEATSEANVSTLLSSQQDMEELLSALTNMGFAEKEVVTVARQALQAAETLEGRIKKAFALLHA